MACDAGEVSEDFSSGEEDLSWTDDTVAGREDLPETAPMSGGRSTFAIHASRDSRTDSQWHGRGGHLRAGTNPMLTGLPPGNLVAGSGLLSTAALRREHAMSEPTIRARIFEIAAEGRTPCAGEEAPKLPRMQRMWCAKVGPWDV